MKHGHFSHSRVNDGLTTFYYTGAPLISVRTDNPDRVCLALHESELKFDKLPSPCDRTAYRRIMVKLMEYRD
jgi:hypothetical protein